MYDVVEKQTSLERKKYVSEGSSSLLCSVSLARKVPETMASLRSCAPAPGVMNSCRAAAPGRVSVSGLGRYLRQPQGSPIQSSTTMSRMPSSFVDSQFQCLSQTLAVDARPGPLSPILEIHQIAWRVVSSVWTGCECPSRAGILAPSWIAPIEEAT